MALQQVGIELIAEGAQRAIQQNNLFTASVSDIGTAAQAAAVNVAPLNIAVDAVSQSLNRLQQATGTTSSTVQDVGNKSTTTANQVKQVTDSTEQAAKGMSSFNIAGIPVVMTLGDIKNAAMSAIQPFINLGREAFGAVSAYQRLAMSMESLVAKEIRSTDATIEMTDALAMAKPRAAELLKWIQDLAINSPFSQEGVAQAFRTAQAYGFTAAEAQRLTKATIDFSSATGASSYQMDIIALALGQIKAKGKLAGQEILQLTNAGLAINPILAKMGFTMNDVSKGVVGADQFVKAFVETLESDFGGAAARTTGTLEGLTSTISDLKTVGLRELFMPFFEAVTPALSAFASGLNNLMPLITIIGQSIGSFTTFLIDNKEAVLTTVAAITAGVSAFLLISNSSLVAGIALKGLGVVFGGLLGTLGAVSTAVTFLLSPIGLLSIAVAGLAALFVTSFSTMQDMVANTAAQAENRFGAMGDKIAQSAAQSSSQAVSDWGEMGDKLAQQAAQNAEESHSWGYNLVIQFANGMADAAEAVIDVLISIGNQIAYWLAPGSPPNIAPDIDHWGTSAMDEFIQGFTKADFSQLGSMTGTIKSFLGSLGDDILDEKDLIPTILGSKEAIAEALAQIRETGSVGQDSIQKIIDTIGVASPELEAYITSLLNVEQTNVAVSQAADAYAASQDKVRQAQEALNAVSEKYNAILAPMNAELAAIAEKRQAFQEGQRIGVLQAIVNDKNAPAIAKEFALMELREIQLKQQIREAEKAQKIEEDTARNAIDIAQDEADAAKIVLDNAVKAAEQAQEQIDLQKAILDLQIEQNNLYKDQASLLEKLGKDGEDALDKVGDSASKAGGKVGELAKSIGGLADGISPLGNALGGAFDGLKDKLDTFVGDVTKPFGELQGKLTTLKEVWATVFLGIGTSLQSTWDTYLKPIFGDWNITLSDLGGWLLKAVGAWLVFKMAIGVATTIATAATLISTLAGGIATLGGYIWTAVSAFGAFAAGLGATILLPLALIAAVVVGLIAHFGGIPETIAAIEGNFTGSGTFGPNGPMVDALNAMSDSILDFVKETDKSFTEWTNTTSTSLNTWLTTTSEGFTTWTTEKSTEFTNWTNGVSLQITMWAMNTLSTFNRWITDSLAKIAVWGISFVATIAGWKNEMVTKFTAMWDEAETLFETATTGLITVFNLWKDDIILKAEKLKTDFILKVTEMWGDIQTGFDTAIVTLTTTISGLISSIMTLFSSASWITLGADIIGDIVQGILDNATALYTALSNLISDAIADALAGIGVGGGSSPPDVSPDNARSSANSFSNSRSFGANSLPSPISIPSNIAPPVNYNRSTIYQQQFTGIGHADVNNGMDVQHLQAVIEMTVMRVMQGQGYGA